MVAYAHAYQFLTPLSSQVSSTDFPNTLSAVIHFVIKLNICSFCVIFFLRSEHQIDTKNSINTKN